MALEDPTIPAPGDPISTSLFGIPVANSIKELSQYEAAGDILFASSATTLARLAGIGGRFPRWDATGQSLEAVSMLHFSRQGGNASNFDVAGTTNYDLATATIRKEMGVIGVVIGVGANAAQLQVFFSAGFTHHPHMMVCSEIAIVDGIVTNVNYGSVANDSFYVYVKTSTNQLSARTINVAWTAEGD